MHSLLLLSLLSAMGLPSQSAALSTSQLQHIAQLRTQSNETRSLPDWYTAVRNQPRTPTQPTAPKPSATPTSTPAGSPTPSTIPSSTAAQIESMILDLTNQARVQNGLQPLTTNNSLASVARAHSADMFAQNYFDHVNKQGCDPQCRMGTTGFSFRSTGENIYMMWGSRKSAADTAKQVVDGWLNSPGHRANLLSSTFTAVGIGVAESNGTVYATSDYATLR